MRSLAPAVVKDGLIVASGVFQKGSQDWYLTEGSVLIDVPRGCWEGGIIPCEPSRVYRRNAKWIPNYVPDQVGDFLSICFPRNGTHPILNGGVGVPPHGPGFVSIAVEEVIRDVGQHIWPTTPVQDDFLPVCGCAFAPFVLRRPTVREPFG
jgi:hypothetical protein